MLTSILLIVVGIVLLYAGGEGLVRGSSCLAIRSGMTPLVVGLTVVAFGTSIPELIVSLRAALDGNTGIAMGNVVGSNIANIGLILGLSALARPVEVAGKVLRVDIPIVLGVTLLLPFLMRNDLLGRWEGMGMLIALVTYTFVQIQVSRTETARVREEYEESLPPPSGSWGRDLAFIVGGLVVLVVGARLLVTGAVTIAQRLGMPEVVIGLTIVAVGTSLPELSASVVAALRREGDISVGNVLGSNLFNILGVLGLTALLHPLSKGGVTAVDFGLMIFYAAVLIPVTATGSRISRLEGALLLAGYAAYTVYLVLQSGAGA